MNDRMTIGTLSFGHASPVTGHPGAWRNRPANEPRELSFRDVLAQQQLKLSLHAEQRLAQRGIRLNPEQFGEIVRAVEQAAAKGARDTLVLYRDVAMIVNIPNRTVVTAMDGSSMKEHVFTQIDSAVIVR